MRIPPLARVLLVLAAARSCVCAQGHFRVAVFNYTGRPARELAPAVDTARRAFLGAGLDSRWTICAPGGCPQDEDAPPRLELFLMPRLAGGGPEDGRAGFALVGSPERPRAYASFEAALAASAETMRSLHEVLGCILAHEAGHLLGLHHQARGVMRARLETIDMDAAISGWAFSAEEKKALRAAVKPRPKSEIAGLATTH